MTKTYTVHIPPADNRPDEERTMDTVFIKEGYSIWAGLFGPFWSLANGMWIEAAAHFGGIIVLSILMDLIGFNAEAISSTITLANLIFGLFARDLQRSYYQNLDYQMDSVVIGKNYDDCEARYFETREKEAQVI